MKCGELSNIRKNIIRRILPPTIRALAWSPVSIRFDARFSAVNRVYRYYFVARDLDISAMKTSCKILQGTHDFRNFCRMDISNNITNYVRRITNCDVVPIFEATDRSFSEKNAVFSLAAFINNSSSDKHCFKVYALSIVGNAFLWHQVSDYGNRRFGYPWVEN